MLPNPSHALTWFQIPPVILKCKSLVYFFWVPRFRTSSPGIHGQYCPLPLVPGKPAQLPGSQVNDTDTHPAVLARNLGPFAFPLPHQLPMRFPTYADGKFLSSPVLTVTCLTCPLGYCGSLPTGLPVISLAPLIHADRRIFFHINLSMEVSSVNVCSWPNSSSFFLGSSVVTHRNVNSSHGSTSLFSEHALVVQDSLVFSKLEWSIICEIDWTSPGWLRCLSSVLQ